MDDSYADERGWREAAALGVLLGGAFLTGVGVGVAAGVVAGVIG